MAYDATVPNATNQVRGASGDIAKMRANFEALEPIILSGLNSLISGGANASGAVPIAQSAGANALWHATLLALSVLSDVDTTGAVSGNALTYNGASWAPATAVAALDDLTDVTAPSPSTGEIIKWNGSAWVNDTDAGGAAAGFGGGGPFNICQATLPSGATESIPNNSITLVTGLVERINTDSAWTVTASGTIIVPASGVTHAQLFAQCTWEDTAPSSDTSFREITPGRIDLASNLVRLDGASGYVVARNRARAVNNAANFTASPVFAVSGGEEFGLRVWQNDGGALDVEGGAGANGGLTSLTIRGFDFSALEARPRIVVSMSGSTTQTLASGTSTPILVSAGVNENVGGWTYTELSGSVDVPADITHVRATAQVRFEDNATGSHRRAQLFINALAPSGEMAPAPRVHPLTGSETVLGFSTGLIAVTAGDVITLEGFHDATASIDVEAGTERVTWLALEGYNLSS